MCRADSGHHNTSQTPSQGDDSQYTLKKKRWQISILKIAITPPKINKETHAGYTGRFSHKNNPPRHSEVMAGRTLRAFSTGLMERELPLLEGAHKVSHALGPSTKQYLQRNLG